MISQSTGVGLVSTVIVRILALVVASGLLGLNSSIVPLVPAADLLTAPDTELFALAKAVAKFTV